MGKYQKYDVIAKLIFIEEFFAQKESADILMSKYTYDNGLNH